jgi:hypothetical protein
MPFLLLRFLLRNLLLFWLVYFLCYLFFSITAFNILSLFSVLVVLMIICSGEVLFWSSLFCVLDASLTWMCNFFLRFGQFCWIYFVTPWLTPFLLLQCPWFTRLVFSWSHWIPVYSFHSSWVFCLRVLLFFSFISILSLSHDSLSSSCSSLLWWLPTVFLNLT